MLKSRGQLGLPLKALSLQSNYMHSVPGIVTSARSQRQTQEACISHNPAECAIHDFLGPSRSTCERTCKYCTLFGMKIACGCIPPRRKQNEHIPTRTTHTLIGGTIPTQRCSYVLLIVAPTLGAIIEAICDTACGECAKVSKSKPRSNNLMHADWM